MTVLNLETSDLLLWMKNKDLELTTKKKLKVLKANVDFLTPQRLHHELSIILSGLRDLPIKTPPPKRQSIKTYIIKEDALTIQSAIKKNSIEVGRFLSFIIKFTILKNTLSQYKNSFQKQKLLLDMASSR